MQVSRKDFETICRIAKAAERLARRIAGQEINRMHLIMDLECVHESTPLRLDDLEKASDADLAHDVFGIRRHLDRRTRKLTDCFCPRFAAS